MKPWYAFSSPGQTALACSACGTPIDLGPTADHHPRRCPACAVECAFVNWKGRVLQVVPGDAPEPFAAFVRWGQQHLDELEYVELLCAFEELGEAMPEGPCAPASSEEGAGRRPSITPASAR